MANLELAEERPGYHRENRKKNRGRKVEDTQARAIAKFIRVPPRKARLVIDEIRGRFAHEALAFLKFIPNRAAGYISKVLTSAVANAVNNHELDAERLKVMEARVDEGPRMKRVQPRAQGRAYRILKRTSHIIITVEQMETGPVKKVKKPVISRAEAARAVRQQILAPAPVAVEENEPEVIAAEETAPIEETTSSVSSNDETVAPAKTEADTTV